MRTIYSSAASFEEQVLQWSLKSLKSLNMRFFNSLTGCSSGMLKARKQKKQHEEGELHELHEQKSCPAGVYEKTTSVRWYFSGFAFCLSAVVQGNPLHLPRSSACKSASRP